MRRLGAGPNRRGGCFRVASRRAYNPLLDLGPLGALWDFSAGVTPILGGVDSILDQSGRGNTLSAPAALNRPAYSVSDADFNSQGSATGDGIDDGVRRAAISMGAAFSPGTMILVAKMVTNISGRAWMSVGVNSSLLRESTVGRLETIQATGVQTTTTTFLARAHVVAMVCDGSTIQQYIDGVPEGAPVAYVGATADGVSVGLFSRSDATVIAPANCKLAYAAISMAALTAAQMAAFGGYSRGRFGTP